MKKGEKMIGIVLEVDFPNKGRVRTEDGESIMVKNVLPGQKIRCVVKKSKKGKAEGRLAEVLEKSPLELEQSFCMHAGVCGGCSYQSLPYDEQLRLKTEEVHKLLAPVISEEAWQETFEGIKGSPLQFAYRNKMEFSFGDAYKDGPLALGMHKRGSFYDIVTVDQCQIIDKDMQRILSTTLSYFAKVGATYYHKMRHSGYLRHLLVRKGIRSGEILVDLITSTDMDFASGMTEDELLSGWAKSLIEQKYEGVLAGVLHTKNDRKADVIEDQGTDVLLGQTFFYEKILGLSFRITPFSFFQTNSLGAEVLYETARDFILGEGPLSEQGALEGKTVYDLYSGTGTIAQILSATCREVIGVEIVEEAVEAAVENARLNGLSNCTFLAGDVLKVLDEIDEKPDFIVLDPPRDGIHPKALKKIVNYGVDSMIYISCKPTSLARDLEVLLTSGYEVEKVCCVDMFPGTVHIESIVKLSRKIKE